MAKNLAAFLSKNQEHSVCGGHIIHEKLKKLDSTGLSADFFLILMHTGLRLSEGLSLSLADFSPGIPYAKYLKGALDRHNLACFGYLVLQSQLSSAVYPRDSHGKVPRKPLKGRKLIDAKGGRTIPLLDKHAFNALARRFNEQIDFFENLRFGSSKSDYLLFDGLTKNRFSVLLRQAYEGTEVSPLCTTYVCYAACRYDPRGYRTLQVSSVTQG